MAIIVSPLLVPLTNTREPSQSLLNSSRVEKSATAVAQTSLSLPKVSIWCLHLPSDKPPILLQHDSTTETTSRTFFDKEAILATTLKKRGKNSLFLTRMSYL